MESVFNSSFDDANASIEEGAEIDVNLGAVVSLARLPLTW